MDRISPHTLTLDPEIQSRAQLDMIVIQEYAEAMASGAKFPPIKAIQQNGTIWVYSGFHRTQAAIKAGVGILAEIQPGTFQDAQYLAAAENQDHGLRRSNADKRRAVEHALIAKPEMSDRDIAQHCGVTHPTVSKARTELVATGKIYQSDQRTGADRRTINTSNIGKSQEPEAERLTGGGKPWPAATPPETFEQFAQDNHALGLDDFGDPLPTEESELAQEPTHSRPVFNRTNENIEWAAWSWNPVTGCEHGCPYCYARDIANRFYSQGFKPTYHSDRLAAPMHTKPIPPRWDGDIGHNCVFVCSMADLFGEWVPDQWINGVMDVVSATPQWRYIFLTKNPHRLVGIDWPKNSVVGTTVDTQARVDAAESAFAQINAPYTFVSCEPLRGPVEFSQLDLFHWVLIGGQSKSSQEAERQPLWDWVEDLHWQARNAGCKVYWKTNLTVRPREYPSWGK